MSFDVSEWSGFSRELNGAGRRVEKHGQTIVKAIVKAGVRNAQAIVAVDTGFLKGSITGEVDGLQGEFGPTAEYGAYVEDGTSRTPAQPYIGPAFNSVEVPFIDAVAGIVDVV